MIFPLVTLVFERWIIYDKPSFNNTVFLFCFVLFLLAIEPAVVSDTLTKSFATAWNTGSELHKVCISIYFLILVPLTHSAQIGVKSLQVHRKFFCRSYYSRYAFVVQILDFPLLQHCVVDALMYVGW